MIDQSPDTFEFFRICLVFASSGPVLPEEARVMD